MALRQLSWLTVYNIASPSYKGTICVECRRRSVVRPPLSVPCSYLENWASYYGTVLGTWHRWLRCRIQILIKTTPSPIGRGTAPSSLESTIDPSPPVYEISSLPQRQHSTRFVWLDMAGGPAFCRSNDILVLIFLPPGISIINMPITPKQHMYTQCQEKRVSHNFYRFRQFFIIFGTNLPDNPCDWKNVKYPINNCTTLRHDDVIVTPLKNDVFGSVSG